MKNINILFIVSFLLLVCISSVNSITGGNITYVESYTIHTFTTNGSLIVDSDTIVEILIVGGGAGGFEWGGGGSGAVYYNQSYSIPIGNYTIIVGDETRGEQNGNNGSKSSFGNLINVSGGIINSGINGGISGNNNAGGLGSAPSYVLGGGGGGSNGTGGNYDSISAGHGGIGSYYNISGNLTCYAGGGGGGAYGTAGRTAGNGTCGGGNGKGNVGSPGILTNATINSGSGGGGGGSACGDACYSYGASGIVILRYIPTSLIPQYNLTKPNFLRPNCSDTSTLIYTHGSNNSYNFNWTSSSNQTGNNLTYAIYYSDILDLSRTLILNTTNINATINSSIMNSISTGYKYFYIYANDNQSQNYTKSSCTFNICENNWVRTVQPCINSTRKITYTDSNSCNEQINSTLPTDSGNYEECVTITYTQKVYQTDILILAILGFFLLISLIMAIFVHEGFFGLCALILGVVFAIFIEYSYPDVLKYIIVFMILMFSIMWIVVARIKRN